MYILPPHAISYRVVYSKILWLNTCSLFVDYSLICHVYLPLSSALYIVFKAYLTWYLNEYLWNSPLQKNTTGMSMEVIVTIVSKLAYFTYLPDLQPILI